MWRYDAAKGWAFAPNTKGSIPIGGSSDRANVRINSIGLRGAEPPAADRAFPLVLVIGDSFVFGIGVDEEHLATSLLERRLQASFPGARVVNAGVSGYSTDQELILFRELAGLKPTAVILVMCDNDFIGNGQDFAYLAYYKPFFTITDQRLIRHNAPVPTLSAAQRAKLWLGRHSILWNGFRSRRSPTPFVQEFLNLFQVAVTRTPSDRPVELGATLVLQMRQEAESVGSRFLATNTGHRGESLSDFTPLRRRYLRPANVSFVRMEETLEKARLRHPQLKWDFVRDTHWNVESHRVVAEVLYESLLPVLAEADRVRKVSSSMTSPERPVP